MIECKDTFQLYLCQDTLLGRGDIRRTHQQVEFLHVRLYPQYLLNHHCMNRYIIYMHIYSRQVLDVYMVFAYIFQGNQLSR